MKFVLSKRTCKERSSQGVKHKQEILGLNISWRHTHNIWALTYVKSARQHEHIAGFVTSTYTRVYVLGTRTTCRNTVLHMLHKTWLRRTEFSLPGKKQTHKQVMHIVFISGRYMWLTHQKQMCLQKWALKMASCVEEWTHTLKHTEPHLTPGWGRLCASA